jgi:hypothetical protein
MKQYVPWLAAEAASAAATANWAAVARVVATESVVPGADALVFVVVVTTGALGGVNIDGVIPSCEAVGWHRLGSSERDHRKQSEEEEGEESGSAHCDCSSWWELLERCLQMSLDTVLLFCDLRPQALSVHRKTSRKLECMRDFGERSGRLCE